MENRKQSIIRTFKPSAKAPDFIKSDIIIDIDEIDKLVKSGENISEYEAKDGTKKRQIKLQLLISKEGEYYFQFNNYKKKENETPF